jgi:xanthine dehydrogenase YagR molybdenum-binding subunit
MQLTTPTTSPADLIGQPVDRVEGPLKVSGSAKYAAEFPVTNLAHAVAVTSTIAKGTVKSIDTTAAKSAPGVLAVITKTPSAPRPTPTSEAGIRRGFNFGGARRPGMLRDNAVHYSGQYLALVVAETIEQARYAATLVRIEYDVQKPNVDPFNPLPAPQAAGPFARNPFGYSRGDVDAAMASAAVKIQGTFITPTESHNPMEPHATIAVWDGDHLTLYDATQNVYGTRGTLAALLGISSDKVHVLCPYLGGGFGTKGSNWPHTYFAAYAARQIGRPVKMVVTRQQMFAQTGHRPVTIQKIALAADRDGKLLAISHDSTSLTGEVDMWIEGTTRSTGLLYSCPAVRTSMSVARINSGAPCQMRGPGETPGIYAVESAMDELAYAANIDPLELRLRNYAERDEAENRPFSSKALRECYRVGAQTFGWSKRAPTPRSMREGNLLIGFGMSTSIYGANRGGSLASVRLAPNGSALVSVAAHDIGTGTYTILTQIAAQTLGLPLDKVHTLLADTALPRGPGAGGSATAATVGNAVLAVSQKLILQIAQLSVADPSSPLHGMDAQKITAQAGRLVSSDNPTVGEPLTAIFARNGGQAVVVTGSADPSPDANDYSKWGWGAHFAEVAVDPDFGQVHVRRYVGRFAAGTVLNRKTAISQCVGGIVMGIGMALLEQVNFDQNQGNIVNDSLADYLVPVNADIPAIDCDFVEEHDAIVGPLGAKGIGELSISGCAAAIANAVYHATGKRVRDLPITCDKVMDI